MSNTITVNIPADEFATALKLASLAVGTTRADWGTEYVFIAVDAVSVRVTGTNGKILHTTRIPLEGEPTGAEPLETIRFSLRVPDVAKLTKTKAKTRYSLEFCRSRVVTVSWLDSKKTPRTYSCAAVGEFDDTRILAAVPDPSFGTGTLSGTVAGFVADMTPGVSWQMSATGMVPGIASEFRNIEATGDIAVCLDPQQILGFLRVFGPISNRLPVTLETSDRLAKLTVTDGETEHFLVLTAFRSED
jgi:hypothetical protein